MLSRKIVGNVAFSKFDKVMFEMESTIHGH